ncbi:MAG TPA: class I SAM-dependent methyltransferase [Rhodopila sp.]|nr:class I SAM-dependent methyltransferase [Rhodopila sp.]
MSAWIHEVAIAMLEKTLALLADVKPATYLPHDVECYDPQEIDALGRVLDRLLYGPSRIRGVLQQKYGVTITRADPYAEIPTIQDLERSFASPSSLNLDRIFPANDVMVQELDRLMKVSGEFDPPARSSRPGEYAWETPAFSFSDAMAYYAMIRTRKPRTILEIGGGWQTAVALMACQKNGMGRIVCVDPNPSEFLRAVQGIEIVEQRVQDLETEFFNSVLREGDLLFIDSTHTVRHDSDCLHLYLRILPAIQASITIQVHDIYLPDTLSLTQMREQQIFWNEQYLLFAYMCSNPRTRAIYGSRYHVRFNPEMLDRFMQGRYRAGGASFWFEQDKE